MGFVEEIFKLFRGSGEIVSLLNMGFTHTYGLVNASGDRLAGIEFTQLGKVGFGILGLIQLRHWKRNTGKYSAMLMCSAFSVGAGTESSPAGESVPSGIRSVKAPVYDPSQHQTEQAQYMTCKACGMLVT